jgi:hypothetical protein
VRQIVVRALGVVAALAMFCLAIWLGLRGDPVGMVAGIIASVGLFTIGENHDRRD